ncbi:hypothetical protein MKW92_038746 [Papaver armeniacum]|nr:hypothetical protein MKW92_038746 [Papaver armeniacum]
MARHYLIFIISSLLIALLVTLKGTYAVTYEVKDRAGGPRFRNQIGVKYSKCILQKASEFNWRVFKQSPSQRKNVNTLKLFVENMDGVAYASNGEIHVSAKYLSGYNGDVKREFTGVIYHEATHIWQWNGNGNAPGGLIEGIADYVRLKANYAPSHWVKPGGGDRWDQGYDVTARFLEYCNSLRSGFVADLNRKMKNGYSDRFFVDLLGKNVNQLWMDYKKKYRKDMAHSKMHLVLFCLVILSVTLQVTQAAVQYEVTNNATGTPGGDRFTREIGVDYSKQTLASASSFIWRIFNQSTEVDRKNVQSIKMFVRPINPVAYATSTNEIHVNSDYIARYSGDVKTEITGVLYHEATHIWQWSVNANGGLIEGIADFVRLKANYAPSHWVKPGAGNRWDQGYDVTARFLDYCNSLRNGFVADLNKKMRTGYSDNYFFELLGKTVDQLWSDYKAKYPQ